MIWHLIAALCSALAGAGVALILRSLTRRRLPKWIIPVFAGLGMLGYTIHYEYTWFDATQTRLPAGSVVVSSEEGDMLWRPWTLQFPMPLIYTVLDNANAQVQETPQGRVARFVLYRFEKHHLMSTVTNARYQLLCSEQAMFQLNDEGEARFETLTRLPEDSPLYQTLCMGEGER
ncbi:hypothetical protein [Pseudomonas sp. NW5]|uniref:hypothetical protein n=1 Tax=Pseudomonas sp. NW5 TaxID=2934934 RepID=UPI0020217A34|nr:hypothetical protein [Pseudomonas sp. NW5]MCL7462413.1 hypothetical protein [Pseudomonas sp. NW5]